MNLRFIVFWLFLYANSCFAAGHLTSNQTNNTYLAKPTGQYNVGFDDYLWITPNLCKNSEESKKKYCHEIMARIYYPTHAKMKSRVFYNIGFIHNKTQEIVTHLPNIPKEIEQLKSIKSFTMKKPTIAKRNKFPVIIFTPGGGNTSELYENFITQLVSHGYIVVGINTQYLGDTKNDTDIENKSIPFDKKVLKYVLEKIHILHDSNALFFAMDLNHIGIFGHSIGARVLADIAHAHPTWFKAAVTLDIGFDSTGVSRKQFSIPFMHIISASRKLEPPTAKPITFELGNNGYLVTVSPNEQNHDFSHHINFTDLSTLQYLPAFQADLAYLNRQVEEPFNIKLMSHSPTQEEIIHFKIATYVLIKTDKRWDIEYFKAQNQSDLQPYHFVGGTSSIKGLDAALKALPNKSPELLSISDKKSINEAIISFHREGLKQPYGTGNGWRITQSINIYLLHFFNKFLKNENNPAFPQCMSLANDTFMKCGPGIF